MQVCTFYQVKLGVLNGGSWSQYRKLVNNQLLGLTLCSAKLQWNEVEVFRRVYFGFIEKGIAVLLISPNFITM